MKADLDKIHQHIENRHISVQKHPAADLFIYTYTTLCQYERVWTPETLLCRGLILDREGNIVARPFEKFFNLEELTEIPAEPFEVYEKLDGSLGILYWLGGRPWIATRGSFASEQAARANLIFEKYRHYDFDPRFTYLFEIIYPENRIVVDYRGLADLLLIAVIDTETGKDVMSELERYPYPKATRYSGFTDPAELKKNQKTNSEGYVVRFESGFRMKIKFEEYKRLHRILTGVSAITVWEMLYQKQEISVLLDRVPDEFYDWVHKTVDELKAKYVATEAEAQADFEKISHLRSDRKAFASAAQQFYNPTLLFNLLDGKHGKMRDSIFRMIRPNFIKPFLPNDDR